MQSLDFCVNRLLMKLFCTNNLSPVEECRHFSIALPSELLRKRVFALYCTAVYFYFVYCVISSNLCFLMLPWWRFGLVLTSLGVSTKLLYVEPG